MPSPPTHDSRHWAMFNVTRVAGTKNGIKAASGGWYATAAEDAYAFTRFGGYSGLPPTATRPRSTSSST